MPNSFAKKKSNNMKQVFVLLALAITYMGMDQLKEGVILYEQKVNMHRRAINVNGQDMRAMIPEFQVNKTQLLFNSNESFYKSYEDEEADETELSSGGATVRFRRPQSEIYKNFQIGQKVELREFMGKKYLIKGEMTQTPWKITSETADLNGYACVKAIMTDSLRGEARNIAAWFTPDIPVAAGPDNFGALPGMILKVDINDGEVVYTALKIEGRPLKKGELTAPSKGKEIAEDDFRKMVEEQMKQMGGQRMIIRNE